MFQLSLLLKYIVSTGYREQLPEAGILRGVILEINLCKSENIETLYLFKGLNEPVEINFKKVYYYETSMNINI